MVIGPGCSLGDARSCFRDTSVTLASSLHPRPARGGSSLTSCQSSNLCSNIYHLYELFYKDVIMRGWMKKHECYELTSWDYSPHLLGILHSIDVVNVHNRLTCTGHHPQWPGWVRTSNRKALRTKLSYLRRRNSTCAQQLQFMSIFSSAHLTAYAMDPHNRTQILDSWPVITQLPMGTQTQTEGSEWLDDSEGCLSWQWCYSYLT